MTSETNSETPLVVQWLSLCAPRAGGAGSIPGQGTGSYMLQLGARMPPDEARDCQSEGRKSEKQKSHLQWNPERDDTNELIHKTETD